VWGITREGEECGGQRGTKKKSSLGGFVCDRRDQEEDKSDNGSTPKKGGQLKGIKRVCHIIVRKRLLLVVRARHKRRQSNRGGPWLKRQG